MVELTKGNQELGLWPLTVTTVLLGCGNLTLVELEKLSDAVIARPDCGILLAETRLMTRLCQARVRLHSCDAMWNTKLLLGSALLDLVP